MRRQAMRDCTHPTGSISSGPKVPSPSWAFAIKGLDEECFLPYSLKNLINIDPI
jgi:hypothetical protein